MGRQTAVVLYVLAMVAVVVGVDGPNKKPRFMRSSSQMKEGRQPERPRS
jgi:hypothetical protein